MNEVMKGVLSHFLLQITVLILLLLVLCMSFYSRYFSLLWRFLLLKLKFCFYMYVVIKESQSSPISGAKYSFSITTKVDGLFPSDISPSMQPQPFIPLLAPSPLIIPFTNNSLPKLSGIVCFFVYVFSVTLQYFCLLISCFLWEI